MKNSDVTRNGAITAIREELGVSKKVVCDLIGITTDSLLKGDIDLGDSNFSNKKTVKRIKALLFVVSHFVSKSLSQEAMMFSLNHASICLEGEEFESSFTSLIRRDDNQHVDTLLKVCEASLDVYARRNKSQARAMSAKVFGAKSGDRQFT